MKPFRPQVPWCALCAAPVDVFKLTKDAVSDARQVAGKCHGVAFGPFVLLPGLDLPRVLRDVVDTIEAYLSSHGAP